MNQERIIKICNVCEAALEELNVLNRNYDVYSNVEHHVLNPNSGPTYLHDKWVKEKIRQGWSHGANQNDESKVHPLLVTHDKLPLEHQLSDILVKSITNSLAPLIEALK